MKSQCKFEGKANMTACASESRPQSRAATGLGANLAQGEKVRLASSIYSRRASTDSSKTACASDQSEWWNDTPRTRSKVSSPATEIVELYRRTMNPDEMAYDARSSTDSRKRSPFRGISTETPRQTSSPHGQMPLEGETVMSMPVCRIADLQVSPSMPTQMEAEWKPVPPDGSRGVGTMKEPVAAMYVFYNRGTADVSIHSRVEGGNSQARL